MMPRIEMALMKEDIRSLGTGDAFRVEAIFGGWASASDVRLERSRHSKECRRESGRSMKEDDHVKHPTPAMQGLGEVWRRLQPCED